MWFESGAPGVPVSFQFPIVYGNFTVPDELEPDFRIPWGAPVRVADMQGGLNATRMPDGSLKSVTGSAGNDIYRGHRLPKDLVGEYLYGEPVGRIVRRIHAEKKDGLTFLHNAYPNNEFIKSLDPFFRPVDVTTAPDGTVYITDMYHGIIQVGNFAGPGTYLRARDPAVRPRQGHSQGAHLAARVRRRQAGPIGRAAARPHRRRACTTRRRRSSSGISAIRTAGGATRRSSCSSSSRTSRSCRRCS